MILQIQPAVKQLAFHGAPKATTMPRADNKAANSGNDLKGLGGSSAAIKTAWPDVKRPKRNAGQASTRGLGAIAQNFATK
jgi:hypothetical protein